MSGRDIPAKQVRYDETSQVTLKALLRAGRRSTCSIAGRSPPVEDAGSPTRDAAHQARTLSPQAGRCTAWGRSSANVAHKHIPSVFDGDTNLLNVSGPVSRGREKVKDCAIVPYVELTGCEVDRESICFKPCHVMSGRAAIFVRDISNADGDRSSTVTLAISQSADNARSQRRRHPPPYINDLRRRSGATRRMSAEGNRGFGE